MTFSLDFRDTTLPFKPHMQPVASYYIEGGFENGKGKRKVHLLQSVWK